MNTGLILIKPPITQEKAFEVLNLIKKHISVDIVMQDLASTKVIIVGAPGRKLTLLEKLKQTAMLDQLLLAAEAHEFERKSKKHTMRQGDLLAAFANCLDHKRHLKVMLKEPSFYQQQQEKYTHKAFSKRMNQVHKLNRGY